jgi:hypothetical protein
MMRITQILVYTLLSLALVACSGIEIEPAGIEAFAAGNYHYYSWRTDPLPNETRSSDPVYAIDPVVRHEVNANLQRKGYVLDPERAQFSVDYIFAPGMLQGERSEWASNVNPTPSVTPNRQVDQASVDNAIALGGVKETNNIILQFNDKASNREVWQVTLSKIVENANVTDASRIDNAFKKYMERALESVPQAPPS